MKLPNGHLAVVTDDKLFGYLLNEERDTQPGHADLFHRLLGITVANGDVLRAALLDAAATQEAMPGGPTPYGVKYEVRLQMTGALGTYTILSVWIIEHGETTPRLITAFIE